jgi:hypothetical protein
MFHLRPFIIFTVASDGSYKRSYKPGAACQNSVYVFNSWLVSFAAALCVEKKSVIAIFMRKFVVQPLLQNGYILLKIFLHCIKNILTLLFLMTFVDSRLFAVDSRLLLSSLLSTLNRLLWAIWNRREQIASWNSQKICKQSLWLDYKKEGSTNPVAETE